ncbi:unnamed protein product [Caretta caretta]
MGFVGCAKTGGGPAVWVRLSQWRQRVGISGRARRWEGGARVSSAATSPGQRTASGERNVGDSALFPRGGGVAGVGRWGRRAE